MQVRRLFLALAGILLLCGQTALPNSIVANYRAYQSALERGDLAAAETAAAAALDESVRRDGNGGRTGVLAVNLAQVRLALGRTEDAYAPALQAFMIASSGSIGVDTLLARLVLGQSELSDARWRSGREHLGAALEQAAARPDLHGAAYDAAVALGRRLLQEGDHEHASSAWSAAADFSGSARGDKTYARGEAKLWQGVSLLTTLVAVQNREFSRPTDTRLVTSPGRGYRAADDALNEALTLLHPYAMTLPENATALTIAQRDYAIVLAHNAVMHSFLESTGQTAVARDLQHEFGPPSIGSQARPCSLTNSMEPDPQFPAGARSMFSVGAVVVRIVLNQQGETVDSRVAAAVPGRWFEEAVERVAPQWRFEAIRENGCQVEGIHYLTIRFLFR